MISGMQLIFLIVAAVTLVAALLVVSARSLVHSALWLVLTLFGVGVMYVLLNTGFFAVAQVLIYIGAIAILFIFAVMLTRKVMQDTGPQQNSNWWYAAIIAAGMLVSLVIILMSWSGFNTALPDLTNEGQLLADLGQALVGAYLLPFELASVLLVAAMIGAIYISYTKK